MDDSASRKNRVFYSLIVLFVVVGVLVVLQTTKQTRAQVLLPSDLVARRDQNLTRVRVAGRVADAPIEYSTEPTISLRFSITNPPSYEGSPLPQSDPLPVSYDSLKPDMFAVGRDVIVEGDLTNGVFVAHKLLTQCPSKYEAPSPDKMYPKQ